CDCRYLQITLISDFFQCESYRGHLKEELWRRRAKWPGSRNCVGCSRRRVKNQYEFSLLSTHQHGQILVDPLFLHFVTYFLEFVGMMRNPSVSQDSITKDTDLVNDVD
ncbi:hypothetical protein pdam_00018030, partial [Pocillopora damicornis]